MNSRSSAVLTLPLRTDRAAWNISLLLTDDSSKGFGNGLRDTLHSFSLEKISFDEVIVRVFFGDVFDNLLIAVFSMYFSELYLGRISVGIGIAKRLGLHEDRALWYVLVRRLLDIVVQEGDLHNSEVFCISFRWLDCRAFKSKGSLSSTTIAR